MELTLLNFSKRMNSTKQPTAADLAAGKTKTIYLKDITNIDNPEIRLSGATSADYAYTYAYIKEWGRYYHIKTADLRHDDMFKISCELDDLATYKSQILNTSAYIVYSSTNYDRWIRDDRCPIVIKDSTYVHSQSAIVINDTPVFEASDDETVIITTISENYGLYSWVMTESTVGALMAELSTNDNWFSILQQQFGDAMGSIVQVIRIPVNASLIQDANNQSQIALGKYITTRSECSCYELQNRHLSATGSIGIPTTYTDFRFTEPYCKAKMSIPFVGIIDFPLSELAPSGGLNWRMDLDVLTGIVQFNFYDNANTKSIASYSGKCGGNVPIANTQISDISNAVSGASGAIVGGAIGAAMGNPITAAIGAISGAASSFYGAQQNSSTVIGSYSGGRSEFTCRSIKLCVEKFNTANEPSNLTDIEGRPVCKVDQLSNYTGYVKTQGFSIDLSVNSNVIKSINSKLDAGIYIE